MENADRCPAIYREDERVVAYAAIRLQQFEADFVEEAVPSISQAIELAAAEESDPAPVKHSQRRARLVAEIGQAVDKAATRLHSIEQEQLRARQVERWRQQGETIYAHIHEISRGQKSLEADGMSIDLDATLSPSENAQAYFERYRKAQSATANLPELAQAAQTDLNYLRQLQTLADLAARVDAIEAVRSEWASVETAATARQARSSWTGQVPTTATDRVSHGARRYDLFWANGPENDAVTFDIAGPDDVWLHARGVPGGHVIIRWAGEEAEDVLEQAAALAGLV